MLILVLNCGSSSLKFQVVETSREQIASDSDRALLTGIVEKIGAQDSSMTFQVQGGEKQRISKPALDHKHAMQLAFEAITGPNGVVPDHRHIDAVGHRVVHGGEAFKESVLIDDHVLKEIEAVSELAPLHNPQNLKVYYASRELLPDTQQAAAFDTSFHQTLPPRAFLYGLSYEFYTDDKIRRYGFHGLSHRYTSWRYARLSKKPLESLNLITCHLGNGCSACAIQCGRSIDTSMGFTPMEGLLMGTRPGDLDPGALLYLARKSSAAALDTKLNRESGLAGLSGGTSDMRDLLEKRDAGDDRARDAIDVFCYRLVKYIAAYHAVLGGADAIIFAGGIGENSTPIREQVCQGLSALGIVLDRDVNARTRATGACISTSDSRIPVWVIPTNEELVIARDTFRLVSR